VKAEQNPPIRRNQAACFVGVACHISNRVAVMYLGKIMEIRNSDELYDSLLHPYTQVLLSAYPVPNLVIERQRQRIQLTVDVPSPVNPHSGCRFHLRCFMVIDMCQEQGLKLRNIDGEHWVACHRI
jgi:oligopeptide transport system ATP-binding protein